MSAAVGDVLGLTCVFMPSGFNVVPAVVEPEVGGGGGRRWQSADLLRFPETRPEPVVKLKAAPILVGVLGRGKLTIGRQLAGTLLIPVSLSGTMRVEPAGTLLIRVTLSGTMRVGRSLSGSLASRVDATANLRVGVACAGACEAVAVAEGRLTCDRAVSGAGYAVMYGSGQVGVLCMVSGTVRVRSRMTDRMTVGRTLHGALSVTNHVEGDVWIANGEITKALLGLPSDLTTVLR